MPCRHIWIGLIALCLTLTQTACAEGAPMKPEYSRAAIRDLSTEVQNGQLAVRYKYPMESMYYSGGVNVMRESGVIKLVIARCKVKGECKPDISDRLSELGRFEAEVMIPYQEGEQVIMVYKDGEQQIVP